LRNPQQKQQFNMHSRTLCSTSYSHCPFLNQPFQPTKAVGSSWTRLSTCDKHCTVTSCNHLVRQADRQADRHADSQHVFAILRCLLARVFILRCWFLWERARQFSFMDTWACLMYQ
jgi:hypothetical protein